VSASILEPAIHDVFVVTVVVTAALLVVAAVMPTRVTEPLADVAAPPDDEAVS
jgi:hypothetical protein